MSMTTDTIVLPLLPSWAWICSLCWVAAWAYIQASLSYFLEQCLQPGQLLAAWSDCIESRWGPTSASPRWFYKPLGGCAVCMNIWLGAVVFGLLHVLGPALVVSGWVWLVPFWVLSNRWLRRMLAENY